MLQWLTDGEPTVAVLEFVTVGTDHTAFLSGSVKGGGRLEGTFGKPTTHYKLRITQIIKWLKNPHSDSAEYALWGNAITVNVGVFVLSGIAYFDSHKEEYE